MKIIGIGIDIIEIKRIEKVFIRFGDLFAYKILTKYELSIYKKNNNKIKNLAKYFTVKEAAIKALSTNDISNNIFFKQIELSNHITGKPKLKFLENTIYEYNIHISFSDEIKYACAIVILEKK
ncbi:holo-[acyl-carrier-protein] synthase [Enterobacteriaceae endosymbiont of Donacia vulgaris]|uniref:holo-ACP synthase n=1 Tax=Enterobacteriaceae endosymbiont of Donacia vulgaris TaxID=2675789 RepID=UPI0014498910|nr:holo-ACP synthase [Enterobacteriaceae endosymbiont of Donacia vulgaris]QJC36874.1 holo-[acyl-carrier-protein] synthase [Enterobacteriaceae endosymbiont of Donacia vulgaris]